MKKIFLKNLTAFAVIMMMLVPALFVAMPAGATGTNLSDIVWDGGDTNIDSVGNVTGLGNADPREIAASVIKVMLGFLGIIAVLIILYAGFLWMTAAGNEDKITQAKGMMSAGVIGLIIVLAAFGIATFVMEALVTATA